MPHRRRAARPKAERTTAFARSLAGISVALSLSFALVACERRTPPSAGPQLATASSTGSPEQLAPGEVPPGIVQAHELVLPRGSQIDRQFGTTIYALVPMTVEELANFIRGQAIDGDFVLGPHGTLFPSLHVKGSYPDHHLRIEIVSPGADGLAHLTVDRIDERPPVAKEPNDEAMRKAGLTPDGQLIHPEKIE